MNAIPTFALALLCALPALATTPQSLANKVYRRTTAIVPTRYLAETTVVFQDNGRFTTLIDANGSEVQPFPSLARVYLRPSRDGTYLFRRISDTEAYADLTYDDGSKSTISIPDAVVSLNATRDTSVQLTDVTTLTPITNLSLRAHVEPGHPVIAGLNVPGTPVAQNGFVQWLGELRREVLIRVVGPGLAQFGVTNAWADPDFQLYRGTNLAYVSEGHYSDWTVPPVPYRNTRPDAVTEAEFRKIFSAVGAFPLESQSKDAAAVVRLNPGSYTIVCNAPAGDAGGEVLIEVYVLP
jgi:hypothetical protein